MVAADYRPPWAGFSSALGANATLAQSLRPFPQYLTGFGYNSDNNGNSLYHSLQTKLEKRMSKGLYLLVSYTGEATSDANNIAFNSRKQSQRRGPGARPVQSLSRQGGIVYLAAARAFDCFRLSVAAGTWQEISVGRRCDGPRGWRLAPERHPDLSEGQPGQRECATESSVVRRAELRIDCRRRAKAGLDR